MTPYGIPKHDNQTCKWGCCAHTKGGSKYRRHGAVALDVVTRRGRKIARNDAKAEVRDTDVEAD